MNLGTRVLSLSLLLTPLACGEGSKADAPKAEAPKKEAPKAQAEAAAPAKPEAKPEAPAAAGAPPSDEKLCQHIVDISHAELKHLDELDPKVEAEAMQDCMKRVHEDREFYGIAFAPLAECVFLATSLSEIGLCEDSFAHALAGEDLDELIEKIALEEPIVDAELCTHRRKIDPESNLADCKAELVDLRKKVGNMDFDAYAWCMMDATDKAHFLECEKEASEAHSAHASTGRVSVAVEDAAKIEEALASLGELADKACACTDTDCATDVAHALDDWTHRYRKVGGTAEQENEAEILAARLIACEQKVAGADWASKVHDLAPPEPKKAP